MNILKMLKRSILIPVNHFSVAVITLEKLYQSEMLMADFFCEVLATPSEFGGEPGAINRDLLWR
jgi:hypothetical protein